jgi:hypothetical protein
MVVILIIFLLIIICVLSYTTYNLLRKNEKLEDLIKDQQIYINSISSVIQESSMLLEEIDAKGTFRSDDEVGFFFRSIKNIQDVLDSFKL